MVPAPVLPTKACAVPAATLLIDDGEKPREQVRKNGQRPNCNTAPTSFATERQIQTRRETPSRAVLGWKVIVLLVPLSLI